MSAEFELASTIVVTADDVAALSERTQAAGDFPANLVGALVRVAARKAGGPAQGSHAAGQPPRYTVGSIVGFADAEADGQPPLLVVDFATHTEVVKTKYLGTEPMTRAEHAEFVMQCARMRLLPGAAAPPPGASKLFLSTPEVLLVQRRLGRADASRRGHGAPSSSTEEDGAATAAASGGAAHAVASVQRLELLVAQLMKDKEQLRAALVARQNELRASALRALQDAKEAAEAQQQKEGKLEAKVVQLSDQIRQQLAERESVDNERAKLTQAMLKLQNAVKMLQEKRQEDIRILVLLRTKLGLPENTPNDKILAALQARSFA